MMMFSAQLSQPAVHSTLSGAQALYIHSQTLALVGGLFLFLFLLVLQRHALSDLDSCQFVNRTWVSGWCWADKAHFALQGWWKQSFGIN